MGDNSHNYRIIIRATTSKSKTQMARWGLSCESRFRQNFKKSFDWLSFNKSFLDSIKSHQLEFVFRDAKQFTGLTHCQARNKEALSFAFNASLSSVNIARTFARQQEETLSVGATKTLLHNAAMLERFIAMSGNSPNMRLKNTVFKKLLFYGVRTVA